MGTRQSGLVNLKISSLVKDQNILYMARKDAKIILEEDEDLIKNSNKSIKNFFLKHHSRLLKWGSVS